MHCSQLTSSFGKNYSASTEQVSTSFLLVTYKQMGKAESCYNTS
ncbi:hypothetical protein ACB092_10G010200 [Castanea dentata]